MNLISFGDIAYWKTIVKCEGEIRLQTQHTFQKQCSLSQYLIVTDKGLQKLSIPTTKSTRKGKYEDVRISYAEPWQRNHWRSIENAYRKAPFFMYYDYKLRPLFEEKLDSLLEFNLRTLEFGLNCLRLDYKIEYDAEPKKYLGDAYEYVQPYPQVFDTKNGFVPGGCFLDILFNLGPETTDYLKLP